MLGFLGTDILFSLPSFFKRFFGLYSTSLRGSGLRVFSTRTILSLSLFSFIPWQKYLRQLSSFSVLILQSETTIYLYPYVLF